MSKLVFPAVQAPYRGFVGEVRGWFQRIASYAEKSPDSKAVINTQVAVLASDLGFVPVLPDTSAVVQNAQTATLPTRVPGDVESVSRSVQFAVVDGAIAGVIITA